MEKVRLLKNDHSQPHPASVKDDWDSWFEGEDVTDDFIELREQDGEQRRDAL